MKCKIRDLELTTDLSAFDDEHVSAALGYICHLTIMLSKFFQVPLRYQLRYNASRSSISDNVVWNDSRTSLPLYRKEVERRRFELAVAFLTAGDCQTGALLLEERLQ